SESLTAVLAKILLEEAPRAREVRPEVPDALDDLVARMLCKDRQGRPRDAAEVASSLKALLEQGAGERAGRPYAGRPYAGRPYANSPRRQEAITGSEQRLLSVVMVGATEELRPPAVEESLAAKEESRPAAEGQSTLLYLGGPAAT